MATANDIINRAGRRTKILEGEEAFAAAEAVDALQLLNDMMHGFGPRGIDYAHTTPAATEPALRQHYPGRYNISTDR